MPINVPLVALRSADLYKDSQDAAILQMYERRITIKDLHIWARKGASIRVG